MIAPRASFSDGFIFQLLHGILWKLQTPSKGSQTAIAAAAHIHILHHPWGEKVSFGDSSQASEFLSHRLELGHVPFS